MNYGFKHEEIGKKDWVAGSRKATKRFGGDIKPDADWTALNPNREHQKRNGLETMNCTNFATHNALIALAKLHGFDFPEDASERYSGVMTGTDRQGNSPHNVIEKIRNFAGVLRETRLPWTTQSKWEEYYSPSPMDENLVAEAQQPLKTVVIGHEWVFNGHRDPAHKRDLLKRYLRRGPICVSVDAWTEKNGVYVKEKQAPDNHWVWLMRYDGDFPVIRDQYLPFEKKLAPDYDFGCAKVYFMSKNESGLDPNSFHYFVWLFVRGRISEALSLIPKKLGVWIGFARS